MTIKTKEAIRSALLEALFVVLGVVLALAANEWRQARADAQQSRLAIAAIVGELQANRNAAAESMECRSGLLELLHSEHEAEWVPDASQFSRRFIFPARVARMAWDSAAETGILAKTDYTLVVEISGVYAQQERYESQARSVGEIIYGEMFRGGTGAIVENYRHLASVIATFMYRERQLVALYDETIASLTSDSP